MHGRARGLEPIEQLAVEFGQRVAHIHDEYHPTQAGARTQIAADQFMPVRTCRGRHGSVAVAGKIHQIAVSADAEEIYMLRATRRFADEGHAFTLQKRPTNHNLLGRW